MIYEFTTEHGIKMVARLVLENERYGLDGCLQTDKPMVEFYMETEHEHNPWIKKLYDLEHNLYFISRYFLDTFLFGYSNDSCLSRGLCLDGSERQYDLTTQECRQVAANLFLRLAENSHEHAEIHRP